MGLLQVGNTIALLSALMPMLDKTTEDQSGQVLWFGSDFKLIQRQYLNRSILNSILGLVT